MGFRCKQFLKSISAFILMSVFFIDHKARADFETNIIGGPDITIEQAPFQAGLTYSNDSSFVSVFCGASVLNHQWVLTAAHCLPRSLNRDIYVFLGSADLRAPDQLIAVAEIVIHEQSFWHDIALIKLASPIKFSDKISPVRIPENRGDHTGRSVLVSGWGVTSLNGDHRYPDILQRAEVEIISDEEASVAYGGSYVGKIMIAAGVKNGGIDSCYGDSGGTLGYRENGEFIQLGIVSWGRECALPGYPGVYVRVSYYSDWIKRVINDGVDQ